MNVTRCLTSLVNLCPYNYEICLESVSLLNITLVLGVLKMECSFLFADMRRDVQEVFKATPHEKQAMMFSATLPKEIRPVCKKFMNNVMDTCCG